MDAPEKKDWLLDERLLQSQKLAAIGELSAGIAHEINNPLAIIRQEAEWMQHLLKKLGGGDGKEAGGTSGVGPPDCAAGGPLHGNHPEFTGFCPETGPGDSGRGGQPDH